MASTPPTRCPVGHARVRLGEGRRSVRARVRYEADGCTKFQTTTKRTREQAETWIAEKKSEYDEGGLFSGPQNLASYLEEWLKDAVEPSVSRRTHQKRAWAARTPTSPRGSGGRGSTTWSRAVQGLYASMAGEGYAHETRLVVHVTLKMALKQGVRWGHLGRNAAEMVDAPRALGTSHSEAEEDFRHLTDAQTKILFASEAANGSRWARWGTSS